MEVHRELYLGWRVPCLGLIIVGHMLQFYAVIAVDHRFKLVSLTSMYSCIETAFDGRDRKSLYLAFTAASVLQAQLLHDIEKLFNNPPSELPIRKRGFPAVSKLCKYPPADDHLHFEIQSFFEDRQSYRLLYVAETQQGQSVLIKFTRRYSIQLHETCARLGHAPRILAFERLPGGWYAVAMEYIESGVSINQSTQLAARGDRWANELRQLMDKFHSEGLVHGDLRDANMLCTEDSVMLIDFDWGGIDGEVSYPTCNLNNELLEGATPIQIQKIKKLEGKIQCHPSWIVVAPGKAALLAAGLAPPSVSGTEASTQFGTTPVLSSSLELQIPPTPAVSRRPYLFLSVASIFKRIFDVPEMLLGAAADYTTAYKVRVIRRRESVDTVYRKTLLARQERTFAIDGIYVHIMPAANKAKNVFDSGKTVSLHIKRDSRNKRYDFEADTPKLAAHKTKPDTTQAISLGNISQHIHTKTTNDRTNTEHQDEIATGEKQRLGK
ncbi:hypothetical protein EDD15DRAFT_2451121 [Pisolithus albus]|nr:hypothetical protein EDD15DRAFT_2451121 [Pisolithus albus]